MDRTETLSFYISQGISSLSQIKNKIVSSVSIDGNGDLQLIYNDATEVRVPRSAPGGQSVHIKQLSVSGVDNTLTITDSNDLVYQLGNLSSPAVANAIVGTGAYLGFINGKHVFKPLVFGAGFIDELGIYGVGLPAGIKVGSNYARAISNDHNYSSSANVWRDRGFTGLTTDRQDIVLNGAGIDLPAGEYWVKATAPAYTTNNFSIRLISGAATLLEGGTILARSTSLETETQNPISGYFSLATPDTIKLQTMHQTSQARISWGRTFLELWKLS